MKPRTVYEKAVQDFTETARQLASLNQHFRQASFAEFEMADGAGDGARILIQWTSGRIQYISGFESLKDAENWIASEAQNWLNAQNTQL